MRIILRIFFYYVTEKIKKVIFDFEVADRDLLSMNWHRCKNTIIWSSVAVYLPLKTSEVQILHELDVLLTPRAEGDILGEQQLLKESRICFKSADYSRFFKELQKKSG